MIKITDEMKDRINKAFDEKKYCVWATTSSDGYPDISFRGSTHVFDNEHIAFWDRSLGTSTTNLENNPHVCMLYYDSAARTGWRFYGTATVYKDGDLRQQIMKRVVKGEIDKDPERKGYGVAEFTPGRLTASLRVVDDVTRPDTQIETLRQFVVEAGRMRVENA